MSRPSGAKPTSSTPARRRLDVLVAERWEVSRERARAFILEGRVAVDGTPALKAGMIVREGADIAVESDERFVGRGGVKLAAALDAFAWSPAGLRCVDVGASTGGFTDCVLQHGAASVAAVDVGYGQLAWKLRQDPRVSVHERVNFRTADVAALGAPFDFLTADVSFIALAKLAPQFARALPPGAKSIALVKPQFEAGREWVRRGGVVRDPRGQELAIGAVVEAFAASGLAAQHLIHSPITGPAGNIEYLLGAQCSGTIEDGPIEIDQLRWSNLIARVVREANETLAR